MAFIHTVTNQFLEDWVEWVSEPSLPMEVKIAIYKKAVKTLPSPSMWSKYTSFLISHYDPAASSENLFSYDSILQILYQAYSQVAYNIPQSHIIWNQYRDFVSIKLEDHNAKALTIDQLKLIYIERLKIPHKTLEDTYVDFSTFITNYDNANYEKEMTAANKIYLNTKATLELRDEWELLISKENSLDNYAAYIQWEITRPQKQQLRQLVLALYERTIFDYPSIPEVWDDYIMYYIMDKEEMLGKVSHPGIQSLIFYPGTMTRQNGLYPLTERSLLACPHSGKLWAHKFQALYLMGASTEELIDFKNLFDNTKIFSEPEKYLDWKAFMLEWFSFGKEYFRYYGECYGDAGTIILDSAESAMERAELEGEIDPDFDLELLILYTLKAVDSDDAQWGVLEQNHGNNIQFWIRRIEWECYSQSHFDYDFISYLYRRVISKNLPGIERIYPDYLYFERMHGTVASHMLVSAEIRNKYKIAQAKAQERLQKENTVPIALNATQAIPSAIDNSAVYRSVETTNHPAKRTHEEVEETNTTHTTDPYTNSEYTSKSKTQKIVNKPSRDRENNSVVVSDLPENPTEKELKKVFKDCGEIASIRLSKPKRVATIEFRDHIGAMAGLTKDKKKIRDTEISVTSGKDTTLYVTNFPPHYTESEISKLFSGFGTVMSIRFPSLKFNTHRRFCYVQLTNAEDAEDAVAELDNKEIDGYKIVVKISDPSKKEERKGALYEDREVFIKGIDFNGVDEKELRKILEPYGSIERVRLPLSRGNEKLGRLHDGYGFVVFSKASEAESAVKSLDGTKLGSRTLHISLASNRNTKKSSRIVLEDDGSIENSGADIAARTLFVSNIPDKVNDTHIKVLFEKYGPLKQVYYIPERGSAKVEFVNVADSGKAQLGLNGYKMGNKIIRVSDKPENASNNKPAPPPKAALSFVPRSVRRHK